MNAIEGFALGVMAVAIPWLLIVQSHRIKRENSEALAERERQLRQAHENGQRGLPFIPQPKPVRHGR